MSEKRELMKNLLFTKYSIIIWIWFNFNLKLYI